MGICSGCGGTGVVGQNGTPEARHDCPVCNGSCDDGVEVGDRTSQMLPYGEHRGCSLPVGPSHMKK